MEDIEDIKLSIDTKQQALETYLPFVTQGAVLVDRDKALKLSDKVKLTISLPELKKEMHCQGKVVWISARNLQGKTSFGIQCLGEEGLTINQTLENYLAGLLSHE